MKKIWKISLILIVITIIPIITNAKTEDILPFKDVKTNDWYYESVKFAYDNKIIMGYTNTKFAPNDKVTRGQLVTILWRYEGNPDASEITNKFKDVPTDDYFTDAVKWAESKGIIHGYNATKFGPSDPITRQDLAVILNNYARYRGLDGDEGETISTFADYSKVKGSYSEPALKWAVKKKVMSGQNINGGKYISPSSNATRAETAAMVSNYINNTKYDEIINEYKGTWYLEGYSDVYITISKHTMYYEAMEIMPMNIDITDGQIYPDGYGDIQISYEDWDKDIEKNKIILDSDYISIKTPAKTFKFIKKKGEKNKYSSSKFYEALGTWYLYNKPEANFEISKTGDDTDPRQNVSYCITPNSFNFTTLDYENSYGGNLGCGPGTNNEILEKYGISISDGEMTITNGTKTVKLYKTPKTIPVSSISLDESILNLNIGDTKTITYTINPENAYNKEVYWSSSDNSVATIEDGVIAAIEEGTTTITVTSNDGNKTATCIVNVKRVPVNSISLNNESLNLIIGETSKLKATISPSNATNKEYTWSSSNTDVATVNDEGKVTAISKGTAIITVTTSDGNKTSECTVTVKYPPLTARASIGMKEVYSSSSISRGVDVTVTASGGTGTYTYYYIKLYKNGYLIYETADTKLNSLYAIGHTNGSYYTEIEVHDSDGEIYKTTSGITTISGF